MTETRVLNQTQKSVGEPCSIFFQKTGFSLNETDLKSKQKSTNWRGREPEEANWMGKSTKR